MMKTNHSQSFYSIYKIITISKLPYIIIFQNVPFYEMYTACSQFGLIDKFESMDDPNVHIIIIQSSDIDKLKHQFELICTHFEFQIERIRHLEPTNNVDHTAIANDSMLLIPPAENSSHNILNALNDDCLREIFNRPEINLMDLAALANVCKRFNQIGQQAFSEKYVEQYKLFEHRHLWRVDEFFRTFGQKITTLYLGWVYGDPKEIVLRLVLDNCTKITKLGCSAYSKHSRMALKRVMPQLEEFTIVYGDATFTDLFDLNTVYPLKKLHIEDFTNLHLPCIHLPQLIDFRLACGNTIHKSNQFCCVTLASALEKFG